jgi:hypothetical protein
VDKIKETGLVPVEIDGAVTFEQASLVFVCNKIYVQDMDIKLLHPDYQRFSGSDPIHTQFIGEIIGCYTKE